MINQLTKMKPRYLPEVATVRKAAGLSQKRLACALGCTPSNISRAESAGSGSQFLRQLAWWCYLIYLHPDPELGWLKAALGLPPNANICHYSKTEIEEILQQMNAQVPQSTIDDIYSNDDH